MQIKVFFSGSDAAWAAQLRAALAQEREAPGRERSPRLRWVGARARPDVILVDVPAGTIELRACLAGPVARAARGVLVAYERCTRELLLQALDCGARGSILKASPAGTVGQALCAIGRGESWCSSTALLQALGADPRPRPGPGREAEEHELTARETEILHLIGQGMSNKEIGRTLEISDQTVKTHLHRVYVKLNRSGRYKAYLAQPAPARPRSPRGSHGHPPS